MTTALELALPLDIAAVQHRTAQIEDIDLEAGTVLMRAAPYDVTAEIGPGLWESFAPKAFERAANAPSRCKLWNGHDGPLIGHATEVTDKADGIWVRSKFSNTANAAEARELAADGTLDQCSVTFKMMREWFKATRRPDGIHVRHSRGTLLGVALVPHGAYDTDAAVVSVREANRERQRERILAELRSLTAGR